MSITAAACPSCVFGATSTSLLSLAYHTIETINVTVNTYIAVYPDGERSTSYQSVTQTVTDLVGSATAVGNNVSRTYTNLNDITWTVGDATLTYPTTYVQYLGFEGAPTASNGGQTCADPLKAASVTLPASTDDASFIYPLAAAPTGATLLPAPLLEYLGQLAPVSDQFGGLPLTGCAPLNYVPATISSGPVLSSSSSEPALSSAPISSSSQVDGPLSSVAAHRNASWTFTGGHPTRLTPGAPVPKSSSRFEGSPVPPRPSGVGESSSAPQYQTYTTEAPTVSHTTAFVIQTLTGRTIVTTKKGKPDSPHHTPGSHHHTDGGGISHHTTKHPHGQPGGHSTGGDSTPTRTGHHDQSPGSYEHHPHHQNGAGGDHHPSPGNQDHHPAGAHHSDTPGSNHHPSPGNQEHHPAGQNRPGGDHHPSPGNQEHHPAGHVTTAGHDTDTGRTHNVFNVGHTHITAKSHGVVAFGSHTVHRGQTVTIGSGRSATTVALQNKGGHDRLVVNGKTYNPHQAVATATGSSDDHQVSQAVITTNGHTITAFHSGKSLILEDGSSKTTVAAGSKVNFEGQTFAVASHGGSVAVNGHHVPLTATTESQAMFTEALVTAGGHAFTALDKPGFVVLEDSSTTATVREGHAITFEGQTISAKPRATAVVVNGKTINLTTGGSATTTGVGDYVAHGLGGGNKPSAKTVPATGTATPAGLPVAQMLGAIISSLMAILVVL